MQTLTKTVETYQLIWEDQKMKSGLVKIRQGETSTFKIALRDENGLPFDLTNFDLFSVCLLKADDSYLEFDEDDDPSSADKSSVDETGVIEVTIGDTDSAGLYTGKAIDLFLEIDNDATPNKKRFVFPNAVIVEEYCS